MKQILIFILVICIVISGVPALDPICSLPKVVGPCKAYFYRYYYNADSGKCESFGYGGCHGNKNNFNNEESCNQVCNPTAVRAQSSSQSRCSLPKEIGPCKAAFSRFYFNTVTKKCESFTYGGCKGNLNNFKSLSKCENTCIKKSKKKTG